MSVTCLAEDENAVNAITNSSEGTRKENLERICALFAYYELVEAMTILELALWKAKVDECDDLNARENSVSCVEQVSSFLLCCLSFEV